MDPGKMTDARSALVNNNLLAGLVVDAGLDPFLLHWAPQLGHKVVERKGNKIDDDHDHPQGERLCCRQEGQQERDQGHSGPDQRGGASRGEDDIPLLVAYPRVQVELVEVPKVLGDLLESLLGAVFLDSGHDLAEVWGVFHRLCPGLDDILENPPCTNYKRSDLYLTAINHKQHVQAAAGALP